MARVGIIGGGSFGTAMACVMRRTGHEVLIWAREHGVAALARQLHVDMPITQALDSVLNHGGDLDAEMARFMTHLPTLYHTG